MEKEKYITHIKQFTSISIKNICLDLKVDYANVLSGRSSVRVLKKVCKEIDRRIKILKER